MRIRLQAASALVVASITALSAARCQGRPEDDIATLVKAYLTQGQPMDWPAVEKLPGIKWAVLPPNMLQNCLPDGSCFTRTGMGTIGGRSMAIIATGARTMVTHLYIRNGAAPVGEAAVVDALKKAGFGVDLARCPIRGGPGTTNWYRLHAEKLPPSVFSIQKVTGAKASEGFILSQGEDLPPLQPNQLTMYSEQCGPDAQQKPVSTVKPHERLAEVVTVFLVPVTSTGIDWKSLPGLPTDIKWLGDGPKAVDLTSLGDKNPVSQNGSVTWSGREFSAMATGSLAQVKAIHLEEIGAGHPRGEHMLGVVYEKGFVVKLVRCGPIYTESTNNWYSITSTNTKPAMIRQSINYDGNIVHDIYVLRLDGTLPARDPRDRDPGVNGCQ